ncbi:MAG: glucose 1-dehydrogenase [Chloroflexi bacterium]|nr:glucose 1-dehydrogenase [Chloroflexota bacterium]MCY3697026.1 glucose 1-dehydrogenase [Chloroflexota bacterium]
MAGRLEGKTALITGGARGQGAAEAVLFAEEGATVVITDVLDSDGEATAATSGSIRYLHHDVTNEDEWIAVVQDVLEDHGKIDAFINNAGIYRQSPIATLSVEEYMEVININQVGVFLGLKHVGPLMCEAGSGSIINISSIAGMRGGPGSLAYSASKWAVRGMTKVAMGEFAPSGVRVNSIHPGLIETPMLHQLPAIEQGLTDQIVRRIPYGRIAEAVEVARLALFLASDDSEYMNGTEFIIDGGMIQGI